MYVHRSQSLSQSISNTPDVFLMPSSDLVGLTTFSICLFSLMIVKYPQFDMIILLGTGFAWLSGCNCVVLVSPVRTNNV